MDNSSGKRYIFYPNFKSRMQSLHSKMINELRKVKKWNIKDKGSFFINVLGIVFDTKTRKILIGRRENDPNIKDLTWSFPGGSPAHDVDLEIGVEILVRKKTGLKVKNLGCVFARIYKENNKHLLIYYLCEVVGGKENPIDDLLELKWVRPDELEKHFTTSFDKRLKEYIMNLG